jgi:hypothetical protein
VPGTLHPVDLGRQHGDEAERQHAVRDGRTERARGGPLGFHVDPLVVAGGLGELVDPLLVDHDPVAGAEILTLGEPQLSYAPEDPHPRLLPRTA